MKKNIVLLLSLTIIVSCAPYVSIFSANKLLKGMSREQVKELSPSGPHKEFQISLSSSPAKKYYVEAYMHSSGVYLSNYFVAYEDSKLLYWGYPYEFSRHTDPIINEIGKMSMIEYEK